MLPRQELTAAAKDPDLVPGRAEQPHPRPGGHVVAARVDRDDLIRPLAPTAQPRPEDGVIHAEHRGQRPPVPPIRHPALQPPPHRLRVHPHPGGDVLLTQPRRDERAAQRLVHASRLLG